MAFSAEELRVLRGALAVALQPATVPAPAVEPGECLQLAEALDEAVREGHRLRSFLLADLARYRAALPGSAAGYLEQLEDALAAGYLPRPDDLAALRLLCAEPAGEREGRRRSELLRRGERLAEQAVRARLLVLPGGRSAATGEEPEDSAATLGEKPDGEPAEPPEKRPGKSPAKSPAKSPEKKPDPSRPVPTPAEVFPPRRRPQEPAPEPSTEPSEEPPQEALPA